jgi:hypothetical protein
MGIIKPTLSITSNASSATTDAGPLSFALSLSVTDSLTVDTVTSEILTLTDSPTQIFDGSALSGGTETPSTGAANQVGSHLFIKNSGTAKAAYVGIVSSHNPAGSSDSITGSDTPTAPHASTTGHLAEAANTTLRTFTLRPGEFAFFPWDYAGDIYAECEHSDGTTLEYFLFDRG